MPGGKIYCVHFIPAARFVRKFPRRIVTVSYHGLELNVNTKRSMGREVQSV